MGKRYRKCVRIKDWSCEVERTLVEPLRFLSSPGRDTHSMMDVVVGVRGQGFETIGFQKKVTAVTTF